MTRYLLLLIVPVLVVGCDTGRPTMEQQFERLEGRAITISRIFSKCSFRGPTGTCFIESLLEPVEWTRIFTHDTGSPIAIPVGVVALKIELTRGNADPGSYVGRCAIDIYVPVGSGNLVRGWGETRLTTERPAAEWRGLRITREPGVAVYIVGLDIGSYLRVSYRVEP